MTIGPSIVAETAADRRLHLFSLYVDFAAAERADGWRAGFPNQPVSIGNLPLKCGI